MSPEPGGVLSNHVYPVVYADGMIRSPGAGVGVGVGSGSASGSASGRRRRRRRRRGRGRNYRRTELNLVQVEVLRRRVGQVNTNCVGAGPPRALNNVLGEGLRGEVMGGNLATVNIDRDLGGTFTVLGDDQLVCGAHARRLAGRRYIRVHEQVAATGSRRVRLNARAIWGLESLTFSDGDAGGLGRRHPDYAHTHDSGEGGAGPGDTSKSVSHGLTPVQSAIGHHGIGREAFLFNPRRHLFAATASQGPLRLP